MSGIENLDKHTESILKNYTIDDLIKSYTQLLVRIEELQKENQELRRQLENKEQYETNSEPPEPLLPDYEEVQDNNGRVWYKRTHYNAQRKESRQIEKYDEPKLLPFKKSLFFSLQISTTGARFISKPKADI